MDNNINPYNRKKEPELNKQFIIEAATEIGSKTDWHQVTFQAIADKTGLSKGGIIHHFRNKEELLDELMNQSLNELTLSVERYKSDNGEKDGMIGYLNFVLKMGKDDRYKKTMRIVLQAIMISPKYRKKWSEWYNLHIISNDNEELSTKSLIIFLVAEGIWYAENMGSKEFSDEEKGRVFKYLIDLK